MGESVHPAEEASALHFSRFDPPPLSHFTFYLPRPNHQQANTFEPPPSQQQQAVVTGSLAELSDGVRVAEMLHDMYVNPLAGRQAGG